MSNSMENVLSRMREASVTLGWGAVAVYSRERLNRLLQQQYFERLGGTRDLPLLSLDLTTRPGRAAAQLGERAGETATLTAISAQRIGTSRVHVALDIDAASEPESEWIPGPSSAVHLSGIEFGTPLLSFSTASLEDSRARLTMNIIAGTCTTTNKDGGKLFSVFNFSEAMNYQLQIDVDLAMVKGSVDRRGRVLLDISKGSSLRCNLFAENYSLNQQLIASLTKWFANLPARCSVFELGSIDVAGYQPLTPTHFILRTQAAPGAALMNAANYGDGAVLVFMRVRADIDNGVPPTRDFPYLLPDGDYSATLVLAEHLLAQASELDLVLLNSLLFPASHEFVERERHTPRDLAVFGNINPLRTTMTLQPSGKVVHAGETVQFTLYNGQGKKVNASRWRIAGLTNHTLATQGSISSKGLYSAPDSSQIGHESLTVVVTGEFDEGGKTFVASERLQVTFERLQLMPRVVSFAQNQKEIHLSAWESGFESRIDWSLAGPALGQLGNAGAGSAVFKPYDDTLLRPLAVQQLQAVGSERGTASLVMVNAQQLLGIEPRFVPRLYRQDTTQLKDTSGMLSTLPRRWRLLAGTGSVDGEGRFTASDETGTRSSVVACEVVKGGVRYATDYSVVQQSQLKEEPTWKSLRVHDIKVVGGPDAGSRGELFGNGFQQLLVEVTVETTPVGGVHYPLSLKELNSIGIYERDAGQRLHDLEDAQGIEDDAYAWATRSLPNYFDQAVGLPAGTPQAMPQNDLQQHMRFYLHANSPSHDARVFYSGLQSDQLEWFYSTATSDLNSRISVTAKPTPDFHDDLYTFKGYRVDGGGTQFELPAADDDEFYLHPNTVDYWKLKYQGGSFLTCELISYSNDEFLNITTLSWENKHVAVEELSFTGWVFNDVVKKETPTHVQFGFEVSPGGGDLPTLYEYVEKYLTLEVDNRVFESGSLVIVNRRVDDVPYSKSVTFPGMPPYLPPVIGLDPKLYRPIAVRLRDRFGNLHERQISHLPDSIVGHRNHMMHTRFDSAKPLHSEPFRVGAPEEKQS
ncbi:hypothetical protein [Pseudomonas sp.]|uniref:hypothetical protein n=1 Tax=Pseudomonas sp. TaxID=306 RepID=UPI001B254691|nr:hypothetical protein [Pseudomonas sp.]MBO9549829.1 hypothetical protein [Pseudomonas sp.]